jgi:hypothetical protein
MTHSKPLLSDQIQEFIDWLGANTDFGDWHPDLQFRVHKKLIECLISVPAEQVEPRTGAGSLD